jgi:hypothetical protein
MPKTATTPVQIEVDQLEDINKIFVYVASQKSETREMVYDERNKPHKTPEYRPYLKIPLRSAIIWDGRDCVYDDKGKYVSGRKPGKYLIEYYDGCSSLFSDQHPKEADQLENFRKSTREAMLIFGHLKVYGYDKMFIEYLNICSWNEESPMRIPTVNAIFKPLNSEKHALVENEEIDRVEEALKLAGAASEKKMRIHSMFLEIETMDGRTNIPVSEKVLRGRYRKEAMVNPRKFIESYSDESLELSSWIQKALDSGSISTTTIPNQAVWGKQGIAITDISGLQSRESILNKLIEVAKSEEGQDFADQLKAIYG